MYSQVARPVDIGAFLERLYAGEIFLFEGLPGMQALVQFTQAYLERAFEPHPPPQAHRHLTHEQQIETFAALGREFSRSANVKRLWRELFESIGLDPERLARDRLRLRFQPPMAPEEKASRPPVISAVPFHRDTWGTNLYAQVNWWAPVYPITERRTMVLYPELWDRPLANTTATFDLKQVMELTAREGRKALPVDNAVPHLLENVDPRQAVPVVIEPGSVIAFSSAHAHAGVPNGTRLTRISLETRTVWIPDVERGAGAPNVDGQARWIAPGLFHRLSDGHALNEILGVERLEPVPRYRDDDGLN